MIKATVLPHRLAVVAYAVCLVATPARGGYAVHDVRWRDMCGVWRLTGGGPFLPRVPGSSSSADSSSSSADAAAAAAKEADSRRPMKEFTTYPKEEEMAPPPVIEEEEVLLMLSDDGTFIQYGGISPSDVAGDDDDDDDDDDEEGASEPPRTKFGVARKKHEEGGGGTAGEFGSVIGTGPMKGTWDFLDGRLILAADRPPGGAHVGDARDTILVGDVVVRSEESLSDNPALRSAGGEGAAAGGGVVADGRRSNPKVGGGDGDGDGRSGPPARPGPPPDGGGGGEAGPFDVRLSVPDGTVEVGRFVYPRRHPHFFERPIIFDPAPAGSFRLRQVLGTLNAGTGERDAEPEEKYGVEDLHGKRYFLTSYPLRKRRGGKRRWSIKYNKYVEDGPKDKSDEEKEREANTPVPIRTMEIELFPNMTFSTFGGFGSAKILRGKWNVIGAEKDQFWMQIWRFGFGRSVSGSTFSEGVGLTQDDAKAYWGRIMEVGGGGDGDGDGGTEGEESAGGGAKMIEVNGSVLDGWGLEPEPVARFTMIEKTEDSSDEDYDEDDDDDDHDDDGDGDGDWGDGGGTFDSLGDAADDIDDIFSSPDAFQ